MRMARAKIYEYSAAGDVYDGGRRTRDAAALERTNERTNGDILLFLL